jgi:hypothetical protein
MTRGCIRYKHNSIGRLSQHVCGELLTVPLRWILQHKQEPGGL